MSSKDTTKAEVGVKIVDGQTLLNARLVPKYPTTFAAMTLRKWLTLKETVLFRLFGQHVTVAENKQPHVFIDNGADILAVAHLDTVNEPNVYAVGPSVIFSQALDDRLGAWVICNVLPHLDIKVDILLTTDEESGKSSAANFQPPAGKQYRWLVSFDRKEDDVVTYCYDEKPWEEAIKACGRPVRYGSYSCIRSLEHLGVCGMNIGVGYRDNHSRLSHVILADLFKAIEFFLTFHAENKDISYPHEKKPEKPRTAPLYRSGYAGWLAGYGYDGTGGGGSLPTVVDRLPMTRAEKTAYEIGIYNWATHLISAGWRLINGKLTHLRDPDLRQIACAYCDHLSPKLNDLGLCSTCEVSIPRKAQKVARRDVQQYERTHAKVIPITSLPREIGFSAHKGDPWTCRFCTQRNIGTSLLTEFCEQCGRLRPRTP